MSEQNPKTPAELPNTDNELSDGELEAVNGGASNSGAPRAKKGGYAVSNFLLELEGQSAGYLGKTDK